MSRARYQSLIHNRCIYDIYKNGHKCGLCHVKNFLLILLFVALCLQVLSLIFSLNSNMTRDFSLFFPPYSSLFCCLQKSSICHFKFSSLFCSTVILCTLFKGSFVDFLFDFKHDKELIFYLFTFHLFQSGLYALSFYRFQNFCASPNFLCRTKNLFTYCASHKRFVPGKKMICIQQNWFLCRH